MNFSQILIPLFFSFLLFNIAFVLGLFILVLVRSRRQDFLFNLSYSLLLGYGVLGYFSLFLSSFGILKNSFIFVFFLIVFLLGYRSLLYLYSNIREVLKNIRRQDAMNKILLGVLVCFAGIVSLAAFFPPFRGDVVVYHLPGAMTIAKEGVAGIWGLLTSSRVAGFPLLMETIYALGITIYGFTLAQLTHYQIFLVLLLVIYVFLREKFGKTYGLLACLMIFGLFELLVNATTAYVDAALVAFDVAGFLVFIRWFFSNKKNELILSALLLGLAASIKYSAFISLSIVVFLLFIKIIFFDKKKFLEIAKIGLIFFGVWLMPSWIWYFKNLVLYLNPFFPFFFNYSLSDGTSFFSVIFDQGRAEFEPTHPRSPLGFFIMPFRAFSGPHYFPVLFGFLTLPFIYFLRKTETIRNNKKIIFLILFYLFAFFALWYFIGIQIRRVAMEGEVVLMILAAVISGTLLIKAKTKFGLPKLLALAFLFLIPLFLIIGRYKNNYLLEHEKLKVQYFFGIKSNFDFYQFQNFKEEYIVADYISKNLQNEKIIDSLCPDDGSFLLAQEGGKNKFVSLGFLRVEENKDAWQQISGYLKENQIRYLFNGWQKKEESYQYRSGACSPDWQDYKDNILSLENLIKEHSELIFSEKGAELYKINLQ